METLQFTVDAALLRELGERLVGQPHIALAELIKNAYDADATLVQVRVEEDLIEIADNGHGMNAREFRDYWMRIGSPHKASVRTSRERQRSLTGSKGVGRLAAQFLATRLELSTSSGPDSGFLYARVNWEEAIRARELTQAEAEVDFRATPADYPNNSLTGTRLTLRGLRQTWDADGLRELGQELWPLQPPFGAAAETGDAFEIDLQTSDAAGLAEFKFQMGAVLRLWQARIVGRVFEGENEGDQSGPRARHVTVTVRFEDGSRFPLDMDLRLSHLDSVAFEIRVFNLRNRQRYGIPVEEARAYFRRFGGVHLYDAGFHLPYYGAQADWLGIEQDHSHRLSMSALLPAQLQTEGGLEYLPTNARLYGVVNIDTGAEQSEAKSEGRDVTDALTIQVSRDRLVDNAAYRELVTVVRTAVDFYATRAAIRAAHEAEADDSPAGQLLTTEARTLEDVVEAVREELSDRSYRRLHSAIEGVGAAAESEAQKIARQAGLLGALATAGIAAVAYEHEAARQLEQLDAIVAQLQRMGPNGRKVGEQLDRWAVRARAVRSLFTPLLDEENREVVRTLRARAVLEQVADQTGPLLRGMEVELDEVDDRLLLPTGTFAEWSALWQNVFVNAANASLDSRRRVIRVRSDRRGRTTAIVAMDTGVGIDLNDAERYFEPFERGTRLSPTARGLGAGGTGLGLTIVRMVARNLGCEARFVSPPVPGFKTAFELSWRRA